MHDRSDMMLTVTLFPAPEGGFTAVCNEIKGAVSEGETEAEAIENLKDAMEGLFIVNAEIAAECGKSASLPQEFEPVTRPLMKLCEVA
jgi:predicted RNase H-like HicB family nuclease